MKNDFYKVLLQLLLPWHPYLEYIFLTKKIKKRQKLFAGSKEGAKEAKIFTKKFACSSTVLVIYFTDVYLVVDSVLFEVEDLHIPHINLKARVQAQEKSQKSYIMLSLKGLSPEMDLAFYDMYG
jgi:hypothetical protein